MLLIAIGLILIVFSITFTILFPNNKVENNKDQQEKINQNENIDEEIQDSEEQKQEQIEQDDQKENELSSDTKACENIEFQTNMFNIIAYISGTFPSIKNCKYVLLAEKDFKNETGGFYSSVCGDSSLKKFPTTNESKLKLALYITFEMSGKIKYGLLSEPAKAYYGEKYNEVYKYTKLYSMKIFLNQKKDGKEGYIILLIYIMIELITLF